MSRTPSARAAAPATLRLHLEEPRRKTALSTVTAHTAGGFLLDRTLYHAPHADYHHKQPTDRGHLLADGHKLKIKRVAWRHGHLVHYTDGPIPSVGAKAQLHLDAPRREQQAAAHTVMHLALAHVLDMRATLHSMPEIVGGGRINLHATFREPPHAAIAALQKRLHQSLATPHNVTTTWQPRDACHARITHHAIALDAVMPQEPTLRLVSIGTGDASVTLPCDAPHVHNTREIGSTRMADIRPAKEGVRWAIVVQSA